MGIGRQLAVSATGSTDRHREVEGDGEESDLGRKIKSSVWDMLSFSAWGITMRAV